MVVAQAIETSDELAWLFDLLGKSQRGATVDYLGRPDLNDLRILIPTSPSAAAATALRRPNDDRSWNQRIQAIGGQIISRLGLLNRAPGQCLALPQFELVEHLARCLGEAELVAAVTIGAQRRNRKPVLQLIRPNGRVVGFAKVGWSPLTHDLVRTEFETLQAINGQLPPNLVAPSVLTVEHWRDVTVAVTSPLRAPLMAAGRPPTEANMVRAIAAAQPIGAETEAPTAVVASSATVRDGLAVGLAETIDLDRLLDRHDGVELPVGLWHGDLTPWNMARRGATVLVWDWEFAGWGRPIGFDALHHHFEHHRRQIGGDNETALAAVTSASSQVLAPIELDLDEAQHRAIVDLYLCELMVRELRLADQRWSGGELATLGQALRALIEHRLR